MIPDSIRTNIFEQLNYEKTKRREQEEKVRALTLNIRWEAVHLKRLLTRRAEVSSHVLEIDPPLTLDDILPRTNKRVMDPFKYILSRTLMRPRDAILFLNECLSRAVVKDSLTMDDIYQAEKRYSDERLAALRDEWRDPYLDIDKVFEQFRRSPSRLSKPDLTECLNKIAELLGDAGFRGANWLSPLCEVIWASGSDARPWLENYGPLIQLLYAIGFLGFVRGKEAVYSYDDPDILKRFVGLDTGQFEIHPAFQQALNVAHT